jgi:hypothetical protein
MISRKIKLFSAAIAAVALIATPTLARPVHKGVAPVDQAHARAQGQGYDANPVVGPDGKLIGAAPDPSVRTQLQQDGLPE